MPTVGDAATTNALAQLRAARHKPIAALIGATAGLVPVGVYEVGHYELTSWSPLECPKAVIVYAGLLFSALTVLDWSANMFGSRVKALGFTLLLEGIMMASSAAWLTAIALTYLVLINAAANGCRLACAIPSPRGLTGPRTWGERSPLRRQRPQRVPRSRSEHVANGARVQARQRPGSRWLPRSLNLCRWLPSGRTRSRRAYGSRTLPARHVDLRRDQAAINTPFTWSRGLASASVARGQWRPVEDP